MRSIIAITFIIGFSSVAFGQAVRREVKPMDKGQTIQPVTNTPVNVNGMKRTTVPTGPSKVIAPSNTEVVNTNGTRRTQQPTKSGIIQSPEKD